MASLIPWSNFEAEYAANFDQKIGAPAKSFRMALGALIIQEILRTTDSETIEHIKENHYLQYFLGLKSYQYKAPFDSSMLVYFRKRINPEIIENLNREIVQKELRDKEELSDNGSDNEGEKKKVKNKGKLILDATCVPSDISYPTDLVLLNKARKKLEKYIDILYKPLK